MSHPITAQITLRGLPADFMQRLRNQAKRLGVSVNRVLKDMLLDKTAKSRDGACAVLLASAGSWNRERSHDFAVKTRGHRHIDPEHELLMVIYYDWI